MTETAPSSAHRWRSLALTLITLGLFAFAIRELIVEMRGHDPHDVLMLVRAMPVATILFAVAATVCGYATLAAFDWLAVRFFHKHVTTRRALLGGFTTFAFVNTTGHTLVVGTIIRLRMYAREGLRAADVAELVAFAVLTYWAGLLPVAGAALLLESRAIGTISSIAPWLVQAIGLACFVVLALHVAHAAWGPPEFRLFGRRIALPPVRVIARQIGLGAMDITFASLALYVLLPDAARAALSPVAFVGLFAIVQFLGFASQVPGGLGIIEALVVKLFAPDIAVPELLASMLAFRAIYYITPFALGGAIAAFESLRALPRGDETPRAVTQSHEPSRSAKSDAPTMPS